MSRKSIKIYFETGQDVGHNIRGIGVHTSQLINYLKSCVVQDKNKADIVHFTYFKPFEKTIVPFKKPKNPARRQARQKWVLTIHDLIPLIYPKHYPSGIRGKINFLSNKFIVRKNIDAVITISETSKKDICRFLKIDPKKVFVTYLAPKEIFKKMKIENCKLKIAKRFKLPDRFALYTGDINYNKNIPNLIKACEIANIPLVIAGKQAVEIENMDLTHPETSHLRGVSFKNVIRLGFVEDEDLNDLYNLAYCYIQPSFYEGFGLPVLEAVACGTPLVVTKTQSLVEILGTDLRFVNPKDPNDMARGINNPNKNIKLPKVYTWEKTAKETLSVYEKILKS